MKSGLSTRLERQRLKALQGYGVLDTPAAPEFDRLVALAASIFEAPMAVVGLVDESREWFKAKVGLDDIEIPREHAICAELIEMEPGSVIVVEDAAAHPRYADNPFVTGRPHLRFYAGAVVTSPEGHNLGTLCVLDDKPRPRPSESQLAQLRALAQIAADELERTQAARRILEHENLLTLAESMSGVGHWRHEMSGRMLWSDEVYRIFGTDPGTFEPDIDKTVAFFHPDDRPRFMSLMHEAMAARAGYEIEFRINRFDGALRELAAKSTCETDERGNVTAIFGVIQDVTEQNQALRIAIKSQASYKLLADSMADVVTRIRLDGHSDYISPAVKKLIGYSPAEMIGRPAQDFVHEDDKPLILQTFAELGAGLEEKTVQHRAVHRDGRPVWVESRFRLLRDTDGQPDEMVAVIRDITDRKVLESQMLAAREAAEVAAAVKSDFLANMSHEIRTPLTSIIGFTSLAAAQTDMPELAKTYVERVEKASRSLMCTVNDILDFSKLEAGQVLINPQPTDVVKLCRSTLDMLMPQAAAKDLQLRLVVDADPELAVVADPDRLRQVLLNLVGNAVKFTDAGSVTLELAYDEDSGSMRLAVSDTGPGIEEDKLDKLFKRFSQVDGSLTRTHGGTGLGLAICKGLVEAMGGQIGAESTAGVGSRFWLTLPVPVCATEAERPEQEAVDHLFKGVRVLVVDDHPANRELARLFLTGAGAEITEAVDGEDAVRVAADAPFDCILMDVRMPKLDGRGALRQIRDGGGANAGIPIIAFTADASREEAGRLIDHGFDAVVPKPVVAGSLIIAVAEALVAWEEREMARQEDLAAAG